MSLHPLAARFASVANAYERGRPEYPPAAIGAVMAELGLAPGARVLDLGAGTGKLSRALIAAGLDVVAVEPQQSLRAVLAEKIGADRAREGLAEAIPLPDASVDAVAVGDAFHWFDSARALTEIHRVLRPGGGLAVLTTVIDWSGASWAHEVGTLLHELRPEHPGFDGPGWQAALPASGGWSAGREVRVTSSRPADPDRIADYFASISWIAAMPEAERAPVLERVRTIVHRGETPPEFPIHVAIGLARRA